MKNKKENELVELLKASKHGMRISEIMQVFNSDPERLAKTLKDLGATESRACRWKIV